MIAILLLLGIGGIAATMMLGGGDDDGGSDERGAAGVTGGSTAASQATQRPAAATTSASGAVGLAATERPTQAVVRETPSAQGQGATATDEGTDAAPVATSTVAATVPPVGDISGPSVVVELRNYLPVETEIVLQNLGSLTLQPGERQARALPVGNWHYTQRADGFGPVEGDVAWQEGGVYYWEFYDPAEVEVVEIVNNLGVPMTLSIDGYGDIYIEPQSSRVRAFPAGEYAYSFRADGFQDSSGTITFTAGKYTQWPWNIP